MHRVSLKRLPLSANFATLPRDEVLPVRAWQGINLARAKPGPGSTTDRTCRTLPLYRLCACVAPVPLYRGALAGNGLDRPPAKPSLHLPGLPVNGDTWSTCRPWAGDALTFNHSVCTVITMRTWFTGDTNYSEGAASLGSA